MVNKPEAHDREVTEKKRRKTSTTDAPAGKLTKEDIYTNTIAFEEAEAGKRAPAKDAQLFQATCEELRTLINDIAKLKGENSDDARARIAEKRIEGSLSFVLLKKLNRLDKVRIRDGREALHKEKLRVDSNRLQLQNLLYEAEHLKREVQRCYLFKSQDEEIELVPVEEFYANAPETISRPEKTKTDEHARRIARLEWELQQRKELDAHLKELQALKSTVAKDIVSKTERLDSLAPRLKDLLVATRPLQEALEMPIEKGWEIQKTVRLLVQPLYLLYANVAAYGEACDNLLTTSIEGDEEEAKQMESANFADDESADSGSNNRDRGDSDNEENEQDQERGLKKRHHRHQPKVNLVEQKREKLLKAHPLSVTVSIRTKEAKGALALTFTYLPNMGIVTMKCSLVNFEISGIAAGDVLSLDNILNDLFPSDAGLVSPNPKTKFQLQELSIEPDQLLSLLKEKNLGKPYRWVQELCGLEFVSNESKPLEHLSIGGSDKWQKAIPSIIRSVRNRWESRLRLYQQIHDLESGTVDTSINNEHGNPMRISSSLLQWSSISFGDYVASIVTAKFVEDSIVTGNDLYFRAIIARGSAKLECYICVPCGYPVASPLWSFSLNWNGKHSAETNSSVREMEFWTNSLNAVTNQKTILSLQLKRAMSCLDVYLETEGPYYAPTEFTQDKSFLKPFRGRTRARPFRLAPNGASSIFTQI